MKAKFALFDEYQLQKHNKTKKKAKPKPVTSASPIDAIVEDIDKLYGDNEEGFDFFPEEDETDAVNGPENLTIKNLVRTLHIKDPGYYVMGILGKNYPKSPEEFSRSRLDGSWDETLAGSRMKLKTAFTWETELSEKGNCAQAWEGLILARKLPYMAAMRNLRNIFLANVKAEAFPVEDEVHTATPSLETASDNSLSKI